MKTIAMFLPQFHDCPYNSSWWGSGFTEWDNVRSAKPLFPGHVQPRIPIDGYYDLADAFEISRQAQVARAHGIDGFSIYHYWYEGKRLLAKPLDLILTNPEIDINFNLCWANHSWTRSWKNRSGEFDVLIEQTYESDISEREKHFEFLCKAFLDSRYIRVGNRPLFQIYMPEYIPDMATYLRELRRYIYERAGLLLHLSAMVTAWRPSWKYLQEFDSATLFQPSLALFSPEHVFMPSKEQSVGAALKARLRVSPLWLRRILYRLQDLLPERPKIFSYSDTWEHLISQYRYAKKDSPLQVFPMAFVDFDNTPRYRQRARLFTGFSAERFGNYLSELVREVLNDDPDGILFINAWNEWGEGMYLQPDTDGGDERLSAVRVGVNAGSWSMT